MITTYYSNENGCTSCVTRKSDVEVKLGLPSQAALVFRLCKECRVDLAKRLLPAVNPERSRRRTKRPATSVEKK